MQQMKEKEELDFNDLLSKYRNKIRVTATKYYKRSKMCHTLDSMYSWEDFDQIGMIALYDCWKRYHYLDEEKFRIVFNKVIETRIYHKAKSKKYKYISNELDDEDADRMNNRYTVSSVDGMEEIKIKELVSEVDQKLTSDITKAIFMELVDPSPRTIFNAILDEKRKNMMKNNKKGNYSYHNVEIEYKHIYKALNLTRSQFTYHLKELRKTIADVLSLDKERGYVS